MKFLIVLACVFLSANALDKEFIEKFLEEMQTVGEKCVEETSASQDDIAALLAHKIPDSHEGICMIFCFHKHFHVQKEDGSLDPEGALKALQPLKEADADLHAKISQVFGLCAAKADIDKDPCVTASGLAKCAEEEGKKLGLSPDMFEI